jgi:hypothetical protein
MMNAYRILVKKVLGKCPHGRPRRNGRIPLRSLLRK